VFILNNNYALTVPRDVKNHVDRFIPEFATRFGPKTSRQILRLAGPAKRRFLGGCGRIFEHWAAIATAPPAPTGEPRSRGAFRLHHEPLRPVELGESEGR
jgi:hypothetical protein